MQTISYSKGYFLYSEAPTTLLVSLYYKRPLSPENTPAEQTQRKEKQNFRFLNQRTTFVHIINLI